LIGFVNNILGNMSEDFIDKILDYVEAQLPLPFMNREIAISAFCSTALSELSLRASIRCGREIYIPNTPETNSFEQFIIECSEIHDGSALLPALKQLTPSHECFPFFSIYKDLVQNQDFSLFPQDQQTKLFALEQLGYLPKPQELPLPESQNIAENISPIEGTPEGQNRFQQISEEHDAIGVLFEGSVFDESESKFLQELDLQNESPTTENWCFWIIASTGYSSLTV
jgi:hypothetical protein